LDLRVLVPIDGPLVSQLQELGIPVEVAHAPAALLKGSQQEGHLWTAAPAITGLAEWSREIECHPYLRPENRAVVYTIGFKAHLAAALAHTRPLVWHLHEFPPKRTGGVWRTLCRVLPDALIVNSQAVAAAWHGWLAPNESPHPGHASHGKPTTVVLNGVDLDLFRPRPPTRWIHRALSIPPDRKLIGMPAVLVRWKGHTEVLQAFRTIQDEFPDADLVFVGGSIYDTVEARQFGAELERILEGGRVHLLPFQTDIELVYPEFAFTVHYSLRPEPFGRVILESMASGIPVIAANEGGPSEILGPAHQDVGWLVPARDPQALAAVMRAALNLPEDTVAAMGGQARHRTKVYFSARRFAEELSLALHRVSRAPQYR
jgi:glycosyltransferase involved in cell wall biosynthesis